MAYLENHESEQDTADLFDGVKAVLLFTKRTERIDGDDLPNGRIGPAYDEVTYELTGLEMGGLELSRDHVAAIWGNAWIAAMEQSEAEND